MGQEIGGTWAVGASSDVPKGQKRPSVTLGDVLEFLREVFQVPQDQFDLIVEQVKNRECADVTLSLKVIEASDLRAKTVRGGSNPFVTVDIPGTNQGHRTRLESETLSPKWNQSFKLKVKNINRDIVKLEVWHDFDPSVSHQVLDVKDLKGLLRLAKNTSATASKRDAHLLGSVSVPLKDIRESGLNEWFPIRKETPKEEGKSRGFIHIEAYVNAEAQNVSENEARRSHDNVLARLVFHHIKTLTNNNKEEESFYVPWQGQLSTEARAVIAQHAIILGLNPALQNLSWWIVGSRVASADIGWQLSQLKIVQKHLTDGAYEVAEIEDLAESFSVWIKNSLDKLRTLRKSFSPASGVLAKHQLSSTLTIFALLESHKQSGSLLERCEIKDIRSQVKDAVTEYMKIWWTKLVEENLKGEMRPEFQIQKVIIITAEVYGFLYEVSVFYGPSLLKEMNIPYFREMFLLITKKLNPCVRPPLMNMYNILGDTPDNSPIEIGKERKISSYTLEDGTNLWQLYANLGRINKLGADLPLEVRKESGIYEYHKWFNRSVKRWVELARNRALQMIEKAVELDNFEPVDEYCDFSSSATDVSGIFTDVQIWWQKLEWPDPENSMILLSKILEDVCSYGMKYADLLKQKVENMFSIQNSTDQLAISKQISTGLNNIERVRDELTRLPDLFRYNILIENVKVSLTGGEEVSNRFRNNIETLIQNTTENMEAKVFEFIEAVIDRMTGNLLPAVIQDCEASSEEPMLIDLLYPFFRLLHKEMSTCNFKRFHQRIWEVVIKLFHNTVVENSDKRKASYFNGIYNIVQTCLKFFTVAEMTREEAKTPEYLKLIELLEYLRLDSESLIAMYYSERFEEQKLLNNQSKGQLVVRANFTKVGKLSIEVIMAKDMHLANESGSLSSKQGHSGGQSHAIDSYVKVQLIPSDWFPTFHEVKTKTLKNCDPAVFEETFDFDLKPDDNGVSNGFLLFTLKEQHSLGFSNTFLGEALIPLKDVECVDSAEAFNVQNMYLKLTQPGTDKDYNSLRALRLRTGDRVATSFLKKLQPRLHDSRQRGGAGSDEEKPRARSPRVLHRIGL